MELTRLNWASAEVPDAKLTVELEGEVPSGWKKHFDTTVKLLGGGEWGKVQVKKHKIRVEHAPAGSEEKLRHYLEGVVEQANAAVAPAESDSDGSAEGREGADEPDGPDAEMTERFRAFAEEEESSGGEESGEK